MALGRKGGVGKETTGGGWGRQRVEGVQERRVVGREVREKR